jgi:hypothetical protein
VLRGVVFEEEKLINVSLPVLFLYFTRHPVHFSFAFGVAKGRGRGRGGRRNLTDTMQSEGMAKNERIANAGNSEMATGQFAQSTKNREGAVPGDHDPRRV